MEKPEISQQKTGTMEKMQTKSKRKKTSSKKKRNTRKKTVKEKPTFPVADIHQMLLETKGKGFTSIADEVPLYLAAVEEYYACELIEMAGNYAISRGSKTVEPEDIVAVIQSDPELNSIVGEAIKDL